MSILVSDGKGGLKELSHEEWQAHLDAERQRWNEAKAKAAELVAGLSGEEVWALRQVLAGESGRYYGDGGTIHHTGQLDVDVDSSGRPTAIWYRCLTLPFQINKRRFGEPAVSNPRELSITGIEYRHPTETVPA